MGKIIRRRSATIRYTLRASEEKNQISQAQFRANSAVLAVVIDGEAEEESSRAVTCGKVHAEIVVASGAN